MKFWAAMVCPGERVKVDIEEDTILHLSHISLGKVKKKKSNESVYLLMHRDDHELVLSTLIPGQFPQQQLDMVFHEGFEISHNWINGTVFFYGYKADIPFGDDDFNEDGFTDEVESGKKRSAEVALKTPREKKAKLITPWETESRKSRGSVHVATPYPSKQTGKTPAANKGPQTPKSAGSHSCSQTGKTPCHYSTRVYKISNEELVKQLRVFLADSKFMKPTMTTRELRAALEDKFKLANGDLLEKMDFIKEQVDVYHEECRHRHMVQILRERLTRYLAVTEQEANIDDLIQKFENEFGIDLPAINCIRPWAREFIKVLNMDLLKQAVESWGYGMHRDIICLEIRRKYGYKFLGKEKNKKVIMDAAKTFYEKIVKEGAMALEGGSGDEDGSTDEDEDDSDSEGQDGSDDSEEKDTPKKVYSPRFHSCKICNKTFNSEAAIAAHNKAKHNAGK